MLLWQPPSHYDHLLVTRNDMSVSKFDTPAYAAAAGDA